MELTENDILNIPFKGRGLENFINYIGDEFTEEFLNCLSTRKKILEIGCGYGQLMLELINLCDTAEIYGINHYCDLVNMEKAIAIAKKRNVTKIAKNPKLNFINFDIDNGLPFENNTFDLIVSQVAIPYIEDKFLLLKEVNRVLKKDGVAFLHVGFEQNKLCNKLSSNWTTLDIIENNCQTNLEVFFNRFCNMLYINRDQGSILRVYKSPNMTLDYKSFSVQNLTSLNKGYYGTKSTYVI